jgi:CheY-like chemotaxis protein
MLARDQVQESLINLLKNAVKYTAQGTVALRIRGNATRLWFEVADTGRGIPRNKRHRLFRAYDRLDSPEPRAGGTGLGLTITEHLVKAMGGCIGHRDSPGGGSVFWIELPISIPAPAPTEVAPAAPPPEMRLSRILLADDLDLTRTVTAELLRSAGHVVTEVSGGEAAIAELQAGDFDLLLTDMRMPVVDGLEVTRRVRALPGHRGRTPVVLLTADLLALHIAETGRAGVDVCVRKPFTRTELLAAVATAARLTPVPDNKASDNVVLDEDALTELRQSLSDEALAAHLGTARGRIADLLTLLERQDAPDNPTLKDAVHDLIGVAGLLGLTPLSLSLRWFDTAEDRGAPGAALHEAATAALSALDRQ